MARITKRRKAMELFGMAGRFDEDMRRRAEDDPVVEALVRRRDRFERSRRYLTDPGASAFYFVLNAERMPILETARAVEMLTKFGIGVGGVVVNRVIPEDAGDFFRERLAAQKGYLEDIEGRFGRLRRIVRLPLLRQSSYFPCPFPCPMVLPVQTAAPMVPYCFARSEK